MVDSTKELVIRLRQNYNKKSKQLLVQQSPYNHAYKMKRAQKCTRTLRTYLGQVIRDIERKCPEPDHELNRLLDISSHIHKQQQKEKNKVYIVHAPKVECTSKGKDNNRYEFGCKVSVAATSKCGWFIGAMAVHSSPYDGHTLSETLAKVERIGKKPEHAFVDMGYRAHGYDGEVQVRFDKRRRGRAAKSLWSWMKRRAAVEPKKYSTRSTDAREEIISRPLMMPMTERMGV